MQQENSNRKVLMIFGSIIITTVLLFIGIFFLLSGSTANDASGIASQQKDSQIVEITAKTGYSPIVSTAVANKPVTLRVDTKGTYDCSSGIRIPKLNISKQLPADGTTDIQIPAQAAGTTLDFTCSMGMYSGKITFS